MTEVKAQSSRMDFLFQASHVLFSSCPELSRFYMSEFQQCLRQQDLIPAKSITKSCCPRCGQIYVPGLNTTVKLESIKKKKKNLGDKKNKNKDDNKSKRKNQLIYQCNACTHKMTFPGSNPHLPRAQLLKTKTMTATPVTIATTTTTTKAVTTHNNTSSSLSKQPVPKQQQQQKQPLLHQQQQPVGIDKKKKKNKGGKKNHLQAMLASRQQSKEAEKKGGGGLGLNDFLSSL
ncbi:RNAse P Rpr2/Rpp21/SNM1 subunit domain-containing protein [Circinella umbellata]|nr:RNAse P Rpr2/Rpp21/SNM1 subunit domain-containing protein [Circinella umbellata]